MSAMHTYVPKLPLFTYYCNARGFVLINKLFIYFLIFVIMKQIYFIILFLILCSIQSFKIRVISRYLEILNVHFISRHFRHLIVCQTKVGTSPVLFSSPVSVSVIREFKIQVHVATCTAKRTYDVIFGVFIKLRTSSYKFTT